MLQPHQVFIQVVLARQAQTKLPCGRRPLDALMHTASSWPCGPFTRNDMVANMFVRTLGHSLEESALRNLTTCTENIHWVIGCWDFWERSLIVPATEPGRGDASGSYFLLLGSCSPTAAQSQENQVDQGLELLGWSFGRRLVRSSRACARLALSWRCLLQAQ